MPDLDAFRRETRAWLVANAPKSMRQPLGDQRSRAGAAARRPMATATSSSGSTSWRSAAGRRRPGRASTAAAGFRKEEAQGPRRGDGGAAGSAPAHRLRPDDDRPAPAPARQRGAEARAPAAHRARRDPLVPGLLRAGRRLGPRQPADARRRDGDDFVLNGQKVWTSYADKADWMFLLVRTDPTAPKHDGITFLLMDMASPGVQREADPADQRLVALLRDVPRSTCACRARNVVGQVNDGWTIAKALLGHERTMIADIFKARRDEQARSAARPGARRYVGRARRAHRRPAAARPHHAGRDGPALPRPDAGALARHRQGGAHARTRDVDLQVLRHRAEQAPPRAHGVDPRPAGARLGRRRASAPTS